MTYVFGDKVVVAHDTTTNVGDGKRLKRAFKIKAGTLATALSDNGKSATILVDSVPLTVASNVLTAESSKFPMESWSELVGVAYQAYTAGLNSPAQEVLETNVKLHPQIVANTRKIIRLGRNDNPMQNAVLGRASTLFSQSMAQMSGNLPPDQKQKMMSETRKQLETLAKQPGLDPEVAKDIMSMSSEAMKLENDFAGYGGNGGAKIQGQKKTLTMRDLLADLHDRMRDNNASPDNAKEVALESVEQELEAATKNDADDNTLNDLLVLRKWVNNATDETMAEFLESGTGMGNEPFKLKPYEQKQVDDAAEHALKREENTYSEPLSDKNRIKDEPEPDPSTFSHDSVIIRTENGKAEASAKVGDKVFNQTLFQSTPKNKDRAGMVAGAISKINGDGSMWVNLKNGQNVIWNTKLEDIRKSAF